MQSRSIIREVWFIRHGESVANAGARTAEPSSYSLTERGFRQAEQLAATLVEEPELIIHSPYVRARQTAEPAMQKFRHVPVGEWAVQEVQYLDPVQCIGTTQDERRELARDYWVRCEPEYAAPEAESFTVFLARVQDALAALELRTERLTFVFSHGHFIRALVWTMMFRPSVFDVPAMRHFQAFMEAYPVPNCAVQPIYFHSTGNWSLGRLNVPDGVEREPMDLATGGLVGL